VTSGRYALFETIRELAREWLVEAGETEAARRRDATYIAA
jgi:hypothetical protein